MSDVSEATVRPSEPSTSVATRADRGLEPLRDPQGTPAPSASPEEDLDGAGTMSFWEHLDELRRRLIYCALALVATTLAAWELRERLLAILVKPFANAWAAQGVPGTPQLHFDAPGAAFMSYFKLSMLGGVVFASPFIFYQLWAFIAPGLYAREKRYVIPFVFFSTLLFVGGGYFGWRTAFPITFDYFLGLSGTLGGEKIAITPTIMMDRYLDFVTQMLLAFGIIFEIPLLILFLSIAGVVNYLQLIRFGRWFILASFIIAAVLTPPDMAGQLMMAIPMCVLYFASIALAFFFGQKPTEEQRAAYAAAKAKAKAKAVE